MRTNFELLPLLLFAMANAFSPIAIKKSFRSQYKMVFEVSSDKGMTSLDEDEDRGDSTPKSLKSSRWEALNPKIKSRIIKAGQERAIANKKKRESAETKKRRMMMFFKNKQLEKKREARVQRRLPFTDRTSLAAMIPGMEVTGVVISLTNFGAYVDVGTECDGLLHVSQISNSFFVDHPRQVLTPGDEVTVRVRSANPELKKLHLTMLPKEILEAEVEDDTEERIALAEIMVDDELWGELKRVTDFGAYVEVGAVVDGFLHFMDHPAFGWSRGSHPSEFMQKGDRVRVWVADVDKEQRRIKLTANRPPHLPGPRREI